MLNEAALLAARKKKDVIEKDNIEKAQDKIIMGLERQGLGLTEEECKLLSYHKAGHAVVAAVLPDADPIHKVTIVPRGQAMGVTQQLPEKDKFVYHKEYLMDRLAVMMGGRVADRLVLNTVTSGTENDLKQATQLARRMVLDWGMTERLGPVSFGKSHQQVFLGEKIAQRREYSEATAREIDREAKAILDEAYRRAEKVLKKHRDALDRISNALVDEKEIDGNRVMKLLNQSSDEE